jgi:hypothetical protein
MCISACARTPWIIGVERAAASPAASESSPRGSSSLFVWLVADGWCWFVLREKYWWLVCYERKNTAGWWLISQANRADHPSEFGTTLGNLPTDPNDMVFGPCPWARNEKRTHEGVGPDLTAWAFLLGKSLFYLPERSTKNTFPPQTQKPGELPPSSFKTVYITSLSRL